MWQVRLRAVAAAAAAVSPRRGPVSPPPPSSAGLPVSPTRVLQTSLSFSLFILY